MAPVSSLYAVVLCLLAAVYLHAADTDTDTAQVSDDFAGNAPSQLTAADKRQWDGKMRVWGKRDDDDGTVVDKRKWGAASGSMRVWGKRTAGDLAAAYEKQVWGKQSDDATEEEKRSWNSPSERRWGKRTNDDNKGRVRKWSQNNMRVWGKRAEDNNGRVRKWSQNNMRVWGKRDGEEEKRTWGGSNMRVWGKRGDEGKHVWGKLSGNEGSKRGWAPRSLPAWGKRSAAPAKRSGSFTFPGAASESRSWQSNNKRVLSKRSSDDVSADNKLTQKEW